MKHNFYPGPSLIDKTVLNNTINQISKQPNSISVLEKSHRSKDLLDIIEESKELTKELLELDNEFEILFLQGGGRQQFYQIPYNLSEENKTSYYVNTGEWTRQAIIEANFFGETKILASSEKNNYKNIPIIHDSPHNAAYTYITTNNTIYGTQYKSIPKVTSPLVADMTSDLFTRKLDFSKFDLFYAGTQKNIGTSGACMVFLKPEILTKTLGSLPTMIDYRTFIKHNSLYNTPPVIALVMALQTLKWYKSKGGIDYFEEQNKQKAELLYNEIDKNSLFIPYVEKQFRSNVNVVFNGISLEVEEKFLNFAQENDIEGIKGHRTLKGFRASMYNALKLSSVKVLVEVMDEFERTYK